MGAFLREKRVHLPVCHFTKREWALVSPTKMGNPTQTGRKAFIRGLFIDLALMTVIGVILALIGPFGSFGDPLPIRLLIWVGFAYLGYALFSPIDWFAQKLAPQLELPEWSLRIAATFVAALPMTIAVWMLPRIPNDRMRWPGLEEALQTYLYVVMIGGLITIIATLVQRGKNTNQEVQDIRQPPPQRRADTTAQRFVDRLPPEIGSEIIALEMEDHYVRVHTAMGNELVLMRMRDAIAELDGLDGLQVHRSWWVARGAVEDVQREGRNVRLKLDTGVEAPVSRANVQVLKDAGWI